MYLRDEGPGLITQELLCSIVFLQEEKGQRKLLTQTSEGPWRVPPSPVFSRSYILIPDPLPQHSSEINKIETNNRKISPDLLWSEGCC